MQRNFEETVKNATNFFKGFETTTYRNKIVVFSVVALAKKQKFVTFLLL